MLDIWQMKRQLAWLAAQLVWGDPPGELVFSGGGVVSEDLEGNFKVGSLTPDGPVALTGTDGTKGVTPFARVSCVGVEWDRESSGRIDRALLKLWGTAGASGINGPGVTSAVAFDTHGINQVTGANRDPVQGQGKSQGRDVDELLMRFAESVGGGFLIDSVHGFQAFLSQANAMETVDGVQVLKRALLVEAYNATSTRFYHQGYGFAATPAGGGVVNLSWIAPPARFDTYGPILRRGTNPGDPAPTAPSGAGSGTGIAVTGGLSGVSASDPGHTPGQVFNYALFYGFTETPQAKLAGTPDRYSNPLTKSVTVT